MITENERSIISMASMRLSSEPMLTPGLIQETVEMLLPMFFSTSIDTELVVRELESRFSVVIGQMQVIEDSADHVVWLPAKKSSIEEWRFWNRYEVWLNRKGFSAPVIRRLDEITDEILGRLEDPQRQGSWDRRGMVVGHVQSGKTANYAGLINKALDAGYKIIIVLAGIHNSLRSQTQLRLDQDVRGYDSQISRTVDQSAPGIGVGTIDRRCVVHSLTDSTEGGDFNARRAVNFTPGGDPVILVVKKNARVLRTVMNWLRSYATANDEDGHDRVVKDMPLLLIDDEADNASVDGRSSPRDENGVPIEELDPTTINRLIRQILKSFEKKAYVGYTATPFANIFIYPSADGDENSLYGKDLFPSSFIINLPAPSNYIGPVQVFGLQDDVHSNLESSRAYPVVRTIADYGQDIPRGHKKAWVPSALPSSLREAILAFWLSCAARRARGQAGSHNSMLIHVTRFNDVQDHIMELVKAEVHSLRLRLRLGDGNSPVQLRDELRQLWEQDFVPTSSEIQTLVDDPAITPLSWVDVEQHLRPVIDAIEFKVVNGKVLDSLDYYDRKDGMTVIAVGGDKLSRGLTLEGLSVSYYLRASTMYDTLLQMGRWFGYRPGYLDLCRLYLSSDLREWYQHITLAYEELRREFDEMVACGGTPKDYGLKVRSHPAGLQITATNKLRHGTRVRVTFADKCVETHTFHTDRTIIAANYAQALSWLDSLGQQGAQRKSNYLWFGVPAQRILDFLQVFAVHPHALTASTFMLSDFITQQVARDNLINWTVVLISNTQAAQHRTLDSIGPVGMTVRANVSIDSSRYSLSRNRLIGRSDEGLDLNEPHWRQPPSPSEIRQMRGAENGLMLLYLLGPEDLPQDDIPFTGFALSFPSISDVIPIEYDANPIYVRLFEDGVADEDSDV